MKRPATSSIVVFVVVLLVTAVIVAAVGFGTDGAPAVEVGDRTTSRTDLNEELGDWADLEVADVRTTPGAVSGVAGAAITTQVVYEMLIGSYFERTGERITAGDRAAAREGIEDEAEFRALPREFRDRFLDRAAAFVAFTRLVGGDDRGTAERRVLRREAARVGVTVDPAYGRWAPRLVRVVEYPTPLTPAPPR